MKKAAALLVFPALLLCGNFSQAGTVVDANAYGDANLNCYFYTFSPTDQSLLMGNGLLPVDQYGVGSIGGSIVTEGDPTLTLQNTINNDTGFPWTGYVVGISMNQFFTISNPSVLNPGWTIAITQQPPLAGPFNGQIVLSQGSGAPVGLDQLLSFSYQITFGGSGSFSETLTPVPEPGTAGLLALGVFGWFVRRRIF